VHLAIVTVRYPRGYLIVVNPTSVSIVMMVMMAKRLAVECIDGRRGRGEEERDRV